MNYDNDYFFYSFSACVRYQSVHKVLNKQFCPNAAEINPKYEMSSGGATTEIEKIFFFTVKLICRLQTHIQQPPLS